MPVVLVVDDEAMVCRLAASALQKSGFRVSTAADGQEAIELFQKDPGDVALLLTDLTMPRKNGVELIQEARALKPELPVVIMSADPHQYQGLIDGVSLVAKPFNPRLLVDTVKQRLAGVVKQS